MAAQQVCMQAVSGSRASAKTTRNTSRDKTNEFDDREFKDEYEKIHRDIEEFTDPIIKALKGLPVYYRLQCQKRPTTVSKETY